MIRVKRAYERYDPKDGKRVLVDRLWPRGLAKEKVRVDSWMQEIAPSTNLRKWFGHDPGRWGEFKKRYIKELEGKQDMLKELRELATRGDLTILYAAKDEKHNNAVVIKQVLERTANKKA